jgi:hypothetical protein
VVIEQVSGEDLYGPLTGTRIFHQDHRMRGFSYEPRGAGQVAAAGILLLLAPASIHRYRWRVGLLVLHVTALTLTTATSGLLTLGVGLVVLTAIGGTGKGKAAALALVIVGVFAVNVILQIDSGRSEVWERFFSERLSQETRPAAFYLPLEAFDATALDFFISNPQHLLFGVGPGLISLASTPYMTQQAVMFYGSRVDALPHTGLILVLSNGGLVSLALLLAAVVSISRSLRRRQGERPGQEEFILGYMYFLLFTALFLMQYRDHYFVFLGFAGLAAKSKAIDLNLFLGRHSGAPEPGSGANVPRRRNQAPVPPMQGAACGSAGAAN